MNIPANINFLLPMSRGVIITSWNKIPATTDLVCVIGDNNEITGSRRTPVYVFGVNNRSGPCVTIELLPPTDKLNELYKSRPTELILKYPYIPFGSRMFEELDLSFIINYQSGVAEKCYSGRSTHYLSMKVADGMMVSMPKINTPKIGQFISPRTDWYKRLMKHINRGTNYIEKEKYKIRLEDIWIKEVGPTAAADAIALFKQGGIRAVAKEFTLACGTPSRGRYVFMHKTHLVLSPDKKISCYCYAQDVELII